ncbi:hypothetical protein HDV02_003325 [Globomyces sp. JEL0801]|nr:hypothetical protein HDV02_003325 [Globomyces sp. JEL0801]
MQQHLTDVFVNTPADAALLIYSCFDSSKRIQSVKRRLDSHERNKIKSGCVFVFSEQESGMRRWTDGMRWSKSRVEGQFLVYRRLQPLEKDDEMGSMKRLKLENEDFRSVPAESLKICKDDVLCKKTFAIAIQGNISHVICYYSKRDVAEGKLNTPTSMALFEGIKVPRDYIDPCNYRLHPKGNGSEHTPNQLQNITPKDSPNAPPNRLVTDANGQQIRYVTVHRIGDPQSLRINLSGDFKDFQRIVMHAFNFSPKDSIRMTVGNSNFIADQSSFSLLRPGDLIQVSRYQDDKKEQLTWTQDFKIDPSARSVSYNEKPITFKGHVRDLSVAAESFARDMANFGGSNIEIDNKQELEATKDAALALASLCDFSRSCKNDTKVWSLETESALV